VVRKNWLAAAKTFGNCLWLLNMGQRTHILLGVKNAEADWMVRIICNCGAGARDGINAYSCFVSGGGGGGRESQLRERCAGGSHRSAR
jgi:hypothetical protein